MGIHKLDGLGAACMYVEHFASCSAARVDEQYIFQVGLMHGVHCISSVNEFPSDFGGFVRYSYTITRSLSKSRPDIAE